MEHEKALRQLAWAIENSTGEFKLILARCNYASLRARLVARLQEICSVEISVLQLRESGRTLYTAISEQFGENLPVALTVVGLESVQGLSQMLSSANQVREEFRKHFPFPLVLWINDDIYKQLMQFAPDLESWATSKNFTITPLELASYLKDVADLWFGNNLRLSEDDYLILEAELEAVPRDLLDNEEFFTLELQAILESLLALVKKVNNQKDAAIEHYHKSLELWQQLHNLECNLKILNDIAYCYYLKSLRISDKTHPDWQATKRYILEYLNLIYEHQQNKLIANASITFGEALRDLEEWDALNKLVNLAIKIHQVENQPLDLARDYGFLAEIALVEERWQGAINFACKALDVLSPISILESPGTSGVVYELEEECIISYNASIYKFILAKAQYNLGEKSEAIRNFETARELGEPIQGLKLYLDILQYLQKLYFEEKEYLKAYDIKQEIFSVEQQFGLRAFIGAGRLQSFKEEHFSSKHKRSETIPSEIAVSTRQLDVERLIERVGRNDSKLTIIYGQSGVGKSSLINAGLEPALKNKVIGFKDNLPIVIRIYTDWQEELAKQINREATNHTSTDEILRQLEVNEHHNIRTVLIFDQFEEFFFVCANPEQRRDFFEFLANCLNILSVKVILSLRVDYLHYLLECNKLSSMKIIGNDILSSNILYELGNFTPSDAKSIIQRLTENANFYLEATFVDKLVEDLAATLGEVRPIELQILGAQLQAENINTLTKYNLLGDKAKAELVKRYLQAVVKNCGAENVQMAELVLYSLTDEKGICPLITSAELEQSLKSLTANVAIDTNKLNLILEIFVISSLIVLVQVNHKKYYQLVHDYLAFFIRQQRGTELLAELEKEKEQRKQAEEILNNFRQKRRTEAYLIGIALVCLLTPIFLLINQEAFQRKRADNFAKRLEELTTKVEINPKADIAKLPSNEYQTSTNISLNQKEAVNLIKKWLEAKKIIFAPPYDLQVAAKFTTGEAYNQFVGEDGAISWLQNNNAYYTYSMQEINSVKKFVLNGNQAFIEVVLTENIILRNNSNKIDTENSGLKTTIVGYNLQYESNTWKIRAYKTSS